MVADGPRGRREIAASDFFRGFLETALEPDEMLTEIRVRKAPSGWAFQKFNRRAQDWAIVGVAAVLDGDPRVALVNMGSTTVRARGTEEALAAGAEAADAAARAAEGLEPPSDLHASAEYRRHLATVLVRRALVEAAAARG
jgi:carbon-monoxide dehydrogenase medium subunit